MRGLYIAIPLSLALWAGIIWLFAEYGWLTMAFAMIVCGAGYILWTIWRDWTVIADDQWADGETTGYGDASK